MTGSDNIVPRGSADAPLAQRQRAQAAREAEIREALVRRHFALADERQLIARLHHEHVMAEAPALRAISGD